MADQILELKELLPHAWQIETDGSSWNVPGRANICTILAAGYPECRTRLSELKSSTGINMFTVLAVLVCWCQSTSVLQAVINAEGLIVLIERTAACELDENLKTAVIFHSYEIFVTRGCKFKSLARGVVGNSSNYNTVMKPKHFLLCCYDV